MMRKPSPDFADHAVCEAKQTVKSGISGLRRIYKIFTNRFCAAVSGEKDPQIAQITQGKGDPQSCNPHNLRMNQRYGFGGFTTIAGMFWSFTN